MSRGRTAAAVMLALTALGLGALFTGCGDDDDVEVTIPEITVEGTTTTESTVQTTESTPSTTTGGDGEGGVSGGTSYDPDAPDSSSNDKPPAPGSPEEAFEKACEQNPAACG